MLRLVRGSLAARTAAQAVRSFVVIAGAVSAAAAQESGSYHSSHAVTGLPVIGVPSSDSPEEFSSGEPFRVADQAPPYLDVFADGGDDGEAFAPSEPWSVPEGGAEPAGYDAETGAVVPENGRLDAEPDEKSPAGRAGSGGPGGGSFGPRAEYRVNWFPDRPVVGQVAELGIWRQDLSLSFPIAPVAKGVISGSVNVGSESTVTDAVLPDSGTPFPRDLSSVSFGVNYLRKFDNGWAGGGGVSLGSASDEPFSDFDVLQVSANGFLKVPRGERDAWLLSLFYAPMSEIPFPIPGVAYLWQPSDAFKANIGLPFSVTYTPTEKLSFEANYLPIRTVRARASYAVLDSLKAYAGYERSNRSWFLAERLREEDRLFSYDQRVASGLEWKVTEKVTADLSGGYAFDRFYFQGENYDDRQRDRIDVADGPFLAGKVEGRW